MLLHSAGLISALLFSQGTPIVVDRPTGVAPCTTSQSLLFADYLDLTRSLEQLIDSSKVITDAVVQANVPGLTTSNRSELGVLLQATNVLKGPKTLQQFAISRMGARGELLLQPGQRFILFLTDESATRLQLIPQQAGIPIFLNVHYGTICIDKDVIKMEEDNVLRGRYEGAKVERLVEDIRAYVGLTRLTGLIQIEGGSYPPVGLMTGVPPTLRSERNDFRVVVTDAAANSSDLPSSMAVVDGQLRNKLEIAGSKLRLTTIDRAGSFQMSLGEGDYHVRVEGLPFGYYVKSIRSGATDLESEPLRVRGTEASDLRIVLTPNAPASAAAVARVSGRVSGLSTMIDLSRVLITMQSVAGMPDARATSTRITTDGRFEFLNVPPGRYVVRVAPPAGNPPGLIWSVASELAVDISGRDLSIELPLFGGIEVKGRIVDRSGNPANASTAFVLFAPATTLDRNTLGNPGAAPSNRYEVRAAADGTFTIWLPAGDYTVTVSAFGTLGGPRQAATAVKSGGADLLGSSLKIDGTTPVEPIVVTLQ